jgi:hypothetical protein
MLFLATLPDIGMHGVLVDMTPSRADALRKRMADLDAKYAEVLDPSGFSLTPAAASPDAVRQIEAYITASIEQGDDDLRQDDRSRRLGGI